MLFTMSMRMCSLASNVHGEHNRNTTLNNTHCNSSQAFDEVSKTFRTVALAADTITAARISQARRRPIQVVTVSTTRVAGSKDLSNPSRPLTGTSPWSAVMVTPARPFYFLLCVLMAWPRGQVRLLIRCLQCGVNGEIGIKLGEGRRRWGPGVPKCPEP